MVPYTHKYHNVHILIWILICLVGFSVENGMYADEIVDRIVAVVNDDIVTYLEVQAEMAPYLKRIKEAGYSTDVEQEMTYRVRRDVIKKLVDQKLTDREIKRNRITASEEEVDNNIEQIKAEKKWTDEDFRKALKNEGLSMESYRKELKQQTLRSKLVNKAVKSNIVITKEDIGAYYDENLEAFAGELKYHLHNIIMRIADSADIGEKEALKRRMHQLRSKLMDGNSIESIIEEAGDPDLAPYSSDLGVLAYKDFATQLKAALDGLPKGAYTAILETQQGYQIFYIVDILREDNKSLEQATPEIEKILFKSQSEKAFAEWIDNLRKTSHIKITL